MKIYLDYIFLENLVINLIIIEQVTVLTKEEISRRKKIIISVLISIYTTITYCYANTFLASNIIKFLIIMIGIYFLYTPSKLFIFLKQISLYYLISFLYVGIVISLSLLFHINLNKLILKIITYVISGVLLQIFAKYIWKIYKSNIKEDDLTYTIYINNLKIKGFIDTGNSVCDQITKLNVIFISQNLRDQFEKIGILNHDINIGIKTVTGNEILKGYVVQDVKIYHHNKHITTIKKIIISFTLQEIEPTEKYSALIGYNTYVENLKGVTIC